MPFSAKPCQEAKAGFLCVGRLQGKPVKDTNGNIRGLNSPSFGYYPTQSEVTSTSSTRVLIESEVRLVGHAQEETIMTTADVLSPNPSTKPCHHCVTDRSSLLAPLIGPVPATPLQGDPCQATSPFGTLTPLPFLLPIRI